MADERFLIVRLSSLGDVIFTLPALAALRDTFPRSHIAWAIDERWQPLLEGNPDLNEVIPLRGRSLGSFLECGKRLRAGRYTCVLDIQGLYKSALLTRFSRAPRRIGLSFGAARESGAAMFYTQRVTPRARHMVDRNLDLAAAAGARVSNARFPIHVSGESQNAVDQLLRGAGIERYIVLSPGGGWVSKCWPPERFGALAMSLWDAHGVRIVVNCGPGEMKLAENAAAHAGSSLPIIVQYELSELMALLLHADLVIAADSGPLHLAAALGTPVVGLYGPTDPARNGPYGERAAVVRNASDADTTYKRKANYSETMLSISVEQVMAAVEDLAGDRLGFRLGNRMAGQSRQAFGNPRGPAR